MDLAARRRRTLPARAALLAGAALTAACSAGDRTITLEITVGHETDALSRAPAVTRVDVAVTDGVGAVARASAAPGGELDFGERTSEDIVSVEVTGVDAAGEVRVRGRSLSGIPLGTVGSGALPVFVQRTGAWARPPGQLPAAHVEGVACAVGERYVFSTGGARALSATATTPESAVSAYDLLGLGGASASALPRTARSIVSLGSRVIAIDDRGATLVDLLEGTTAELVAPAGLAAFADVAGGATLPGPDGAQLVVGATRAAGPTRAVLRVDADGRLTAAALVGARAGAAAGYVDGVGLVVAGGSDAAPGVEILSPGGATFASTAFPADPTTGGAVVPVKPGVFAVVGGVLAGKAAPTRTFEVACGSSCAAIALDGATPPAATRRTAAYALGGERAIVVGDTVATGETRAWRLDLGARSQAEIPLREPRLGAAPVPAPNGTLALVGGTHADGTPALTVEMFFPE